MQHYRMGDLEQPYLVEQYHAITGEPLSDEPDYNHSYYLELIFAHVAGLSVEKDKMVIDPVDVGLTYFKLDHVKVKGKEIGITYSDKDRSEKGLKKGFTITVDGKAAVQMEHLGRVEIEL